MVLRGRGEQLRDNLLGVGANRQVDVMPPAKLGRVDVNLNVFGLRVNEVCLKRHVGTEEQDGVCGPRYFDPGFGGDAAGGAHVGRIGIRHDALAQRAGQNRQVQPLGQRNQVCPHTGRPFAQIKQRRLAASNSFNAASICDCGAAGKASGWYKSALDS